MPHAVPERHLRSIIASASATHEACSQLCLMLSPLPFQVLDINIKAAILLAKEVLPYLSRGSGIVFVSSITAYNPPAPIGLYAVSKTALLGLVKVGS
jgi:dehydrogenase/reductase SDR family protein 4